MTPFVTLQSGFGLGERFLAVWRAWNSVDGCATPQRPERLVFIAVDPHPPTLAELTAALTPPGCESPDRDDANALLAAWPPLTPNLHRLSFASGRVQLLLLVSELLPGLSELVADVNAFVLNAQADADVAVSAAPLRCDERVCKALGRLAAPGASVSIRNAAPAWRQALKSAGFAVTAAPDDSTAEPSTLHAVYAPAFTPRRAPARSWRGAPAPARHALIVGAGLAGCAAAWALAEQGWHSTVLERHSAAAAEGSGNAAGLFHGIVNAQDGLHARFNRAAALEAQRAVQIAVAAHGVAGNSQGLLRLERELTWPAMQATLSRLGLLTGYLQALDATTASEHSGIPLGLPAWFYPGGGWVHPGGLARSFLERAGTHAALRVGHDVQALVRSATGWRAFGATGKLIAEADVVVLANAGDALRLLDDFGGLGGLGGLDDLGGGQNGACAPMEAVRGQISWLPTAGFAWPLPRLPRLPRLPIAGAGYLLPEANGLAIFGATAQRGDTDTSVRVADHILNVEQLERLTGTRLDIHVDQLQGRTAWRWVTGDRLPIIGAVPDSPSSTSWPCSSGPAGPIGARSQRLDQPRFVPRQAGLFVFTALGSRGITWCALGAQILAASVSGAPMPVEASLLDAVDPARFVARRFRRAGSR